MRNARFVLVAVTFSLTTLLYVDRIAISAAKGPVTAEFGISDTAFGWVLSAFALGYALFQAPIGALADRLGPRIVLAAIAALWSVFTGATGLAWGIASLIVFRFLFGVAEAGAFPACARAIYMWLPAGERAFGQGVNLSGSRLGAAFSLPLVAWLVTAAGWRNAFLALGALGVVWAIGWFLWFRDSPADHPSISPAELAVIVAGRDPAGPPVERPPPFGALLRSANVRLLMGQYFASNFTFFFCLTWLFPYLQQTYGLTPVETGFLSAIPLVGGACGNWISGLAADMLFRRGLGGRSRRLVATTGFALGAVGLIGAMSADSAAVSVAWLTVAVLGSDMTTPPSWAVCIDIGGRFSGSVSGLMNMAGNLGSFVTSLAFPYLVAGFGSTAAFFLIGAMLNVAAMICWSRIRPERGLGAISPQPSVTQERGTVR